MPATVPRSLRRGLAALTATVATAAGILGAPSAAAREAVPAPVVDTEDAEMEAAVLAREDRRLTEVRTVTSLARWQGRNWKTPYRLGSASGYTLVLTPRATPYTVEDLLVLAPQTFLRMSDGSYLLSEHLVVTARATLRLSAPGGLTLRLASGHDGFATIVSLGGKVELVGEEGAPVVLTSWDVPAGEVDRLTTDGRAYVRAIGGQFEAHHVELSDMGFWSGRTGGLALTGTDRPNTGAIESLGADEVRAGDPSSLLDDVTWQPAGPLPEGQSALGLDASVPALDFVSTRLSNVDVERNAFGLFVSGANGVQVSDSSFTDNLLGGVVLHRYVTNGVIRTTTSSRNAGDGFTLNRATTGIEISESLASRNAGSGFRLAGRPLATGPSPLGASLRSYGNNAVRNSVARDNGRYGIELLGGHDLAVHSNTVDGHDMGIMVNGPATRVSVTGNTVRDADRHGVALINGVEEATVTGNVIDEVGTGVYLRDSTGEVKGNTVEDADVHGVTLVGEVGGSEVSFNVLAGSGASALDTHRSDGRVVRTTNNTDGWHDTTPWYVWFRKLLQPMNALWTILALLLAVSALRARRTRGVIEHPYAHQMAHQGYQAIPQPKVVDLTEQQTAAVR